MVGQQSCSPEKLADPFFKDCMRLPPTEANTGSASSGGALWVLSRTDNRPDQSRPEPLFVLNMPSRPFRLPSDRLRLVFGILCHALAWTTKSLRRSGFGH